MMPNWILQNLSLPQSLKTSGLLLVIHTLSSYKYYDYSPYNIYNLCVSFPLIFCTCIKKGLNLRQQS